MFKHSSKTAFALTPLALAAALATGTVHAQGAVDGNRVGNLIGNVTQSLGMSGDRIASRADRARSDDTRAERGADRLRDVRNDARERREARRNGDDSRSLRGLAAADRSLRERARDGAENGSGNARDPIALNLAVDTGNLSGARDARGYGIKVDHSTKLHPGSEESRDSDFFDEDNETRRTGVESGTKLAVSSPRINDDGDRERVSTGLETDVSLANHAATDRDNGQSFRSAELGGFYVQKTAGEDELGRDDTETDRRGAALKYDSREGFNVERGNGD